MVQLHDNVCLGEWVHLLRRQKKKQLLSRWHIECLKRVQFVWKVPQQTALWHYHLHEARRYKVLTHSIIHTFFSLCEAPWCNSYRCKSYNPYHTDVRGGQCMLLGLSSM